ncbi:MAG: ATP-binding protein [Synergistaceae bacterium]|nr:ATP-binding protein [Synergistaceae bacterium]
MIKRAAEKALKRLASQFPVVGITGPRQSGKTTLAKLVFPEKRYISFDDKSFRELAGANPIDFLRAFPDGLIIDEAQKVPDIFDAVKYFADNCDFTPGKFILTGSSQFRLKENMAESLAGRAAFLRLLPFSISELKAENLLPKDVYDLIFYGQYPPLYDLRKNFDRMDWYESYINGYLDLDVKDMINPSNVSSFRKFIQLCAVYSGQILSKDSIARDLGISAPTVKNWLSILEASSVIYFLDAVAANLGKALIKSPKLYFADTGLLCSLLGINSKEKLLLSRHKGAIVENFAVAELLKSRLNAAKRPNLAYYRDRGGLEVDAVAEWERPYAIEIKSDSRTEKKMSAGARKYAELRSSDKVEPTVFYTGEISCQINGARYVSWKNWGDFDLADMS